MNYDISELNTFDLTELKKLCRSLGVSVLITKEDLISRLVKLFPSANKSSEDIIRIKQEVFEEQIKPLLPIIPPVEEPDLKAKSVTSDTALNSEASAQFVKSVASDTTLNSEASAQFVKSVASDTTLDSEASAQFVKSVASDTALNSEASAQFVKSVASDTALNSEVSAQFEADSSLTNFSVSPSKPIEIISLVPEKIIFDESLLTNSTKPLNGIKGGKSSLNSETNNNSRSPTDINKELERRKRRAERFNTPASDLEAATSNLPVSSFSAVSSLSFQERFRKRAERFNLSETREYPSNPDSEPFVSFHSKPGFFPKSPFKPDSRPSTSFKNKPSFCPKTPFKSDSRPFNSYKGKPDFFPKAPFKPDTRPFNSYKGKPGSFPKPSFKPAPHPRRSYPTKPAYKEDFHHPRFPPRKFKPSFNLRSTTYEAPEKFPSHNKRFKSYT